MLSFEDKIFIKNLWECKRFSARRLLREFPNKNWKRRMQDDFLRRLCTTSSIEHKAASANCLERTRAADRWQCCRPVERSFGSLCARRGWTFWAHTL